MIIGTLQTFANTEHWTGEASCAEVGHGGDFWFVEKGGSVKDAKTICRDCPVRSECLQYALKNRESFGIWGGLTQGERRRLERRGAA